ncbi:MAG: hypothetical protein QOE14_2323 [Humisphaera sp.]|nr:hypothetical protein [Humisphaera sp.]
MAILSYRSRGAWRIEAPPITIRVLAMLHILIGGGMLMLDVTVMPGFQLGKWGAVGWFIMTWQAVMTSGPLLGGLALQWQSPRARSLALFSFGALAMAEVITFGHGLFCWIEGRMTGDKAMVAFGTIGTMMSIALLVFSTSALQYLRDLRPCEATTPRPRAA